MVLLSSVQRRSGVVVSPSGALATGGECAMDGICGDERRVRLGRVCNWLKVFTEDGPANCEGNNCRGSKQRGKGGTDVVKAEIVRGDISLAGCPRVVRFMRENMVHRGTSYSGGWEAALRLHCWRCSPDLHVLGTRSRVWIPIVHDGPEVRNKYFSMNAVIVQNERPTTRSYLWRPQGWAHRWAIVLDKLWKPHFRITPSVEEIKRKLYPHFVYHLCDFQAKSICNGISNSTNL